jgi:hypothetical protein
VVPQDSYPESSLVGEHTLAKRLFTPFYNLQHKQTLTWTTRHPAFSRLDTSSRRARASWNACGGGGGVCECVRVCVCVPVCAQESNYNKETRPPQTMQALPTNLRQFLVHACLL